MWVHVGIYGVEDILLLREVDMKIQLNNNLQGHILYNYNNKMGLLAQ